MSRYRQSLPQLSGETFLTDGGMETTLIFHEGRDLPCLAAFDLMATRDGRDCLIAYYRRYLSIAAENSVGFILETPTWRASPDWGARIGYGEETLKAVNAESVALLAGLREECETPATKCVVSGCVGPRGDGYAPDATMTATQAEAYHAPQIGAFAEAGADMVGAITMTHAGEAAGIVRAARAAGMPTVISFTVETDGCLPDGQPLGEAIGAVDDETEGYASYFMINCAHPSHFVDSLTTGESWLRRIHGVRANASRKSHAELDNSDTLDEGDPVALAKDYRELRRLMPWLNVLGGCCGTDHRHVAAICAACVPASAE